MTRVEWTYSVETSRSLRLLALAGFGAIGALPLLGVLLALWLAASAVAAGDFETLGALLAVGLAVALLVGRRLAVQVALFQHGEAGPELWLPFREVVAASAAWAAVPVVVVVLDAPFAVVYGLFVASVLVCVPLVAALTSDGTVDTDAGELRVNQKDIDLRAVDRVDRYDVGSLALLHVRYHEGGGSFSSPRLLAVPRGDAERVRDALESSTADPPEPNPQPLVAAVLAAFGVGLFAFAAFLVYGAATWAVHADGRVVFAYAAVFAVVLGALFLALAQHER